MKNKLFAFSLFLLTLYLASCKKERLEIVGQWTSVVFYSPDNNGTYSWSPSNRFRESYQFSSDGRFAYWTDVPGVGGTYFYDNKENLILNYEANRFGSPAHTIILKVEKLTNYTLIIPYFYTGQLTSKTEFSRIK